MTLQTITDELQRFDKLNPTDQRVLFINIREQSGDPALIEILEPYIDRDDLIDFVFLADVCKTDLTSVAMRLKQFNDDVTPQNADLIRAGIATWSERFYGEKGRRTVKALNCQERYDARGTSFHDFVRDCCPKLYQFAVAAKSLVPYHVRPGATTRSLKLRRLFDGNILTKFIQMLSPPPPSPVPRPFPQPRLRVRE